MKSRLLLSFVLISFFTACSKNECNENIFNIPIFEANKTYCVDDQVSLTIRLVGDSRCPTEVFCVHAGWVDVNLEWSNDATTKVDSLIISPDGIATFEKLGINGDFSLKVNSVDPYPISTSPIPVGHYQFKFEFKK